MAYAKHNFYDGQVLTANHMNLVEDQVVSNEKNIKQISDSAVSSSKVQSFDKTSRITAKNNVGIYIGPDAPSNPVEGDIWITEGNAGNEFFEVDDTLTIGGAAADAEATGNAIRNQTHSGNDITSGVVSEWYGGTGQTSLEDLVYTVIRYRASSLHMTAQTPSINGAICWQYE